MIFTSTHFLLDTVYITILSSSGHLPACLGQLVHLENLHLDNNNFEGEVPKSLKSLEHLVVLKLENNKLSGKFSFVFFSFASLTFFSG